MKTKLLVLTSLCTIYSLAQIPSGYYSSATGSGYILKTQLYNIIKGQKDNGYSGLWTTYETSDRDNQYENDNSILDIYSENPSGKDPYTYTYSSNQCGTYSVEGDCYNREHIIPQSIFNSASPMVADAHFITPTDGKVNSVRSNYPHGNVAVVSHTSKNGSKLGTSAVSGYTGTVFEPINEFKGDVARMYFYFATRYENTVSGYSYSMFDGTSNQVFTKAFLNLLLSWHANDPVSTREIARNNAIYIRQGNRNPYIDYPEYVNMIWVETPIPPTGGSTVTELFFSEYIEGSANNKALEIANKTANSINLSNYSIKKQTNGAGSWSSGLTFSGNVASNSKLAIANSNIDYYCYYDSNSTKLLTSATEMTFNGNDAVGLFKNGILIDIIGTYNGGSANFGMDVTLRRKSTVTGPSTSFNKTSQWDSFTTDTCSGLGNRSSSSNVTSDNELNNVDFKLFPNPSNNDFTVQLNSNQLFKVQINTLIGQKVYEKDAKSAISISNLQSGIYLVTVTTEIKSVTKRIIIN
jgi:endonuclease I